MKRSPCIVSLFLAAFLSACARPEVPAPTVTLPAASASASVAPVRKRDPVAFFSIESGVFAPVACFDGATFLAPGADECRTLVPEGAAIAIFGSGVGKLLGKTNGKCMRGESTFDARAGEGPKLDTSDWAIWPASATSLVNLDGRDLKPTPAEQKALEDALAKADDGNKPPRKLEVNSGVAADMDGDGKLDRVFAGHEQAHLFGLVAVFRASDPATPVVLSSMQFDYPKIAGTSDLDGNGRREAIVSAAFVEGVDGNVLTSAISVRLVELAGAEGKRVGEWGCRRF